MMRSAASCMGFFFRGSGNELEVCEGKKHEVERIDKSGKKDVGGSYVNLYPKPLGCGGFYVNTQTHVDYVPTIISVFPFYLCFITLNFIS